MSLQTINIGVSANDGTGDPLRTAFDKVNDNFLAVSGGVFNVKDPAYGAVGDGVTDDSAAIEACFAAARATFDTPAAALMTWGRIQGTVYFPAGDYIYNGSGISQGSGNVLIYAEPGTVSITVTGNVYFLTVSGAVYNAYVSGIHFIGGKGYIKYTATTGNVAGEHIFERCYFDGYTECAVGNNSTDQPYWEFENCEFLGAVAGGTIGIAIGGYIDGSSIRNCKFLRNKYHLKIGDRISGSVTIAENDFITYTSGVRQADIWLVPNSDGGSIGASSGEGVVIEANKFGNENQAVGDVRILIAEEGAGADRLVKHHTTTFDASAAFLTGIYINDNRIVGVDSGTAPVIKSYINNVRSLTFKDNLFDGGSYTYLIERSDAVADEDAYVTRMWDIRLGLVRDQVLPFSEGISNYGGLLVQDPLGEFQGSQEVLLSHNALGDDASFVSLASANTTAGFSVYGSATTAGVNDIYGTARGATVTCPSTSSGIANALSGVVNDRLSFLEMDLKTSSSQAMEQVIVEVYNFTTGKTAVRRTIVLPSAWLTIRIPFSLPTSTSNTSWQARIRPVAVSVGVTDKFDIARLRCYSGRQPMNSGHLRTAGTGKWDGEHIVIGSCHIWEDGNNRLRIKSSAPSSASDGALIHQNDATVTNYGFGIAAPSYPIHGYVDNATTTPIATIEQDGSGDCTLQFLHTASLSWCMGADFSDSKTFKLAPANNGFAAPVLAMTTGGALTISGVLNVTGQAVTVAGALTLGKTYHSLSNSSGSTYAVTLAAPTSAEYGITKTIEMIAGDGTNTVTLSLANCDGGTAATTCTWNAAAQKLVLQAGATKWTVIKQQGVTLS